MTLSPRFPKRLPTLLRLGAVAGLFATVPAWAAYSIEIEAQVGAARPIHGSLTLGEGESGTLMINDTTLRLTPTLETDSTVRIQAALLKKTDSGFEVIARPTVITHLNQAAEISQSSANGAPDLRVRIVPKAEGFL